MGESIWRYTNDSLTEKEECYPIRFCKNTLTLNGAISQTIPYEDPVFVLSAKYDIFTNS